MARHRAHVTVLLATATVAMLALDAMIHTRTVGDRTRVLPLDQLYRLPGDTPEIETVLAAAAKLQGRALVAESTPEKGFFYRSDHFEFAKQGVAVGFCVIAIGTDLVIARDRKSVV